MAKTPESVHTDYVRKKLKEAGVVYPWKIIDDYQGGVPDSYYVNNVGIPARSLFLEAKYIKEFPVRDSTIIKPKWSSGNQEIWCNRLADAGEQIAVVIFVGTGVHSRCIWFDKKEDWTNGITTERAKTEAISRTDLVNRIHWLTTDGKYGVYPSQEP